MKKWVFTRLQFNKKIVSTQYIWIALLMVASASWKSFIVSSLHITTNMWAIFAISSGLYVFASLWLIGDFVTPGKNRNLLTSMSSLWGNKWKSTLYIFVALIFSGILSFFQTWNNTLLNWVGALIQVAVGLIAYGLIFVLSTWISRGQLKRNEVTVGKLHISPRSLLRTLSPFGVALVVYGVLFVVSQLMQLIGVSNGTGTVVMMWFGAFGVGWFLTHISDMVHQFAGTSEVEIPLHRKSSNLGLLTTGAISISAIAVSYYVQPGIALFNLSPNYWIDNAFEQTSAEHGGLENAFLFARAMQAQSLEQYAYLLYEKKDFKDSQVAINNALQADPSLATAYEIQAYDALQSQDYQTPINDYNVLENMNQSGLASWVKFYTDTQSQNSYNLQSDLKNIEEAGVPSGLLPYQPRTVLTSTKGTEKTIQLKIHHADLALMDLPIEAIQQKQTGESVSLAQQLESAWPTNSPYANPADQAQADMVLADVFGQIGDLGQSLNYANLALGVNGASSETTKTAQELVLAIGSIPTSNQNPPSFTLTDSGPTSMFENGVSDYVQNNISGAAQEFQQVVQNHPNNGLYGEALSGLAICDYKLRDMPDAFQYAKDATKQSDKLVKAVGYTVLGNIEDDQGNNPTLTISDYQQAVANNPNEYLAWYYMGVAYQSENQYYKAINAFSESVQAFTKDNQAGTAYATGAPQEGFGFTNTSGSDFTEAEQGIQECITAIQSGGGN